MQTILLKSADPLAPRADLLVVPVPDPPTPLPAAAAAVDAALGGIVAAAAADGEVRGKAGALALFHTGKALAAPRVAVVGIGKEGKPEDWRTAGEAAARRAGQLKAVSMAVALPEGAGPDQARAFVEGAGAGDYRFDRFKTPPEDEARTHIERLSVIGSGIKAADLTRADRTVAAVARARDLANTPANYLTPRALAEHAQALADDIHGLDCEVLEESDLERLNAGAILGVARGSDEPPRMIVLRYTPKRAARKGELLGLVGKAVTFDSGGISIKPSGGMEEMKMDMGGGAAVIEGMGLIARLGLQVPVLAVVPATENMPSGHAIKPGDVLTAMNGKTIEVINTDAEGRLILADALYYTATQGATRMVDLATLTGAIVVALGEVYAGLFGSDEDWTQEVRLAGEASGDLAWAMPMHPRYDSLIRSKVADLANAAKKRQAGPVYAAQFLREFTDGKPWCHLDVAGTAMVDGQGTGYGVRLIAALAERLASRR